VEEDRHAAGAGLGDGVLGGVPDLVELAAGADVEQVRQVADRRLDPALGVATEMPMPLSSQTNTSGSGLPTRWAQRAALMPASAAAWLSEASPNEHIATASSGTSVGMPRRRLRPIANAAPTAFGRWEPIVEVCGGTHSGREPQTLWRPPDTGSSRDAVSDSSPSHSGSASGSCRPCAIISAPER
jgi:hypothetical protein